MSGHKALPPPLGYTTMPQLAEHLGYSVWMLYYLRRKGVFSPALRLGARRVYYHTKTAEKKILTWAKRNAGRFA